MAGTTPANAGAVFFGTRLADVTGRRAPKIAADDVVGLAAEQPWRLARDTHYTADMGFTPASFVSSRANRMQKQQAVEDFMDAEDLRSHVAMGRTLGRQS